jgi:hypothetical protein
VLSSIFRQCRFPDSIPQLADYWEGYVTQRLCALTKGLPIASGVVEAACKTLATQRMKQSGMSWGQTGGQAILTLRSLIQSNRWEQGWALLRADFRKQVNIVKPKHDVSLTQQKKEASIPVFMATGIANPSDYHSLPLVA